MRSQFVLDKATDGLLDELAASRAGNRSFVVREAIRLYAALEEALGEVESDAGFRRLMDASADDIGAGRVVSHAQVKRRLLKRRRT